MNSASESSDSEQPMTLQRQLGLFGATALGLGSIVGTGVFVSIKLAAQTTNSPFAVLLAIVGGALVALCNGLSSAQLAASHPVSGGTYEYGYRWLTPSLGFTAGWMFLCAKGASAATAAMVFAGYSMALIDSDLLIPPRYVAMGGVVLITLLVALGLRRSNRANLVLVAFTISAIVIFCLALIPDVIANKTMHWVTGVADSSSSARSRFPLFEATALMFVSYTGYGRIATMGEEIHDPRRNIPIAIVINLSLAMFLYLAVATTAISVGGIGTLQTEQTAEAPLEEIAREFGPSWLAALVAVGAVTATLGVLLNLVLGLSRVVLAMGRRGDLPRVFASVGGKQRNPIPSIALVGAGILVLVTIGDIRGTWSFSAFTVLIYYSLTNLAALRLSPQDRRFPRWISVVGLVGCLLLAGSITVKYLVIGSTLILLGLLLRTGYRRIKPKVE